MSLLLDVQTSRYSGKNQYVVKLRSTDEYMFIFKSFPNILTEEGDQTIKVNADEGDDIKTGKQEFIINFNALCKDKRPSLSMCFFLPHTLSLHW